ncbi:MAG: hypothetical protein HRT35_23820 [Algicola sp.]|nr:hypothetical protein [Algicola sp.]
MWTQPKLIDGKLDFAKFKAGASPLIDEKPHLLHPEVDFPEQHFEFEVDSENKGISIKAIDNNLRGEQTIAICKLNRESLRLRRQKNVIKDAVIGLNVAYASHIHQQQDCNIAALFTSLESAIHTLKIKGSDIDNEHTLLRQYIIKSSKNFMKMIAPFVLQIPHNQLAFAAQRTLD